MGVIEGNPVGVVAQRGPEVQLDALGYLQAVYRGKIIPEGQRMKAAIACLPFEVPKLGVVVNYNVGFASRLEQKMERHGKSPVIDARPNFQKVEDLKETD